MNFAGFILSLIGFLGGLIILRYFWIKFLTRDKQDSGGMKK